MSSRNQSRTLRLGQPLGVHSRQRTRLPATGIEHIFTGYDRLAFLFGLLIIAAAVGASSSSSGDQQREISRRARGAASPRLRSPSVTLCFGARLGGRALSKLYRRVDRLCSR